jgi:CDP-diacylglycerol--glycerol-3-phosphate 3-phosphatidyltransferase
LVITAFVFSDNVDGIMARISDQQGPWGAFLDSVLDRFGDAAIFIGLALWFAGDGDDLRMVALCLACLALGAVVSYARARAESLGYSAAVGIAERADRLVAVLVTTGLVGWFDLSVVVLEVVLWLLAAASAWTVFQRVRTVRQQSIAEPA